MVPSARFDDLTPGREHAFEFHGHRDTFVARSIEEVVPTIAAVAEASRAGLWAAGFVAYEAAPAFDPGLAVRHRRLGEPLPDVPLAWFATYTTRIPVAPLQPRATSPAAYTVSGWTPEIESGDWHGAISTIKERIGAGDTYQVNHTFRLHAAFAGDPRELYRDLVLAQRGGYAASLDTGRYHVASASPELFFRVEDREIATRPMKGTIARGRWPAEDLALAEELVASEKDQAENLMIVDLLRNDLGRIAEFGSVRADRLLDLERYETLWTLTSEITAQLRDDVGITDVFAALFPSGSVTGAPKAATMAIIADLERSARGVYCGAVGYVGPATDGTDAQFNVAIRTVVVDTDEGIAEYGVGGGITWDSDASNEYEEARTKARLLVERRPEFDLFETIRWEPGRGFVLLDGHVRRLAASAAYFGFVFDRDHVMELLDKTASTIDRPMRVRVALGRHGSVTVEIDEQLLEPFHEAPDGSPVRVAVAPPQIDPDDVFLYHKTTRRNVYEMQREDHPFAEDVLLVNRHGELTESTIANVAVRFGDTWYTPHLDSGLLPGVYRESLLASGVLHERIVRRDELFDADAVALVNSVRGWRPVVIVTGDEA
jgi:para-aminobenzoate synthetase/4-amino-4-deoxychorismate lyase